MRFKRVYIEISNICNLNCSFCSPLKREKRVMQIDEFSHIINEIKPFSDFVYFHIKGEPLLHPNLKEFLDIALENGIQVNLTTNGTLLKKQGDLILNHKAVRQVNLSLHAFNEIDKIDNDDYIETALMFAKKANEKKIYVVMRLWNLDKHNNTDKNSLRIMEKIQSIFEINVPLVEKMGGRQSVKIAHHAFVGWEQEFEWPSIKNPFVSDKGYCYGMRHQIGILVDGTVVPCCLDANGEAPLGNIFKETFADIVSSKTAKEIRHGFENKQCSHLLCKHCSFRTKFEEKKVERVGVEL